MKKIKSGTSLIELLIAIGAISVVLITIAAAASQALSAGIFSRTQALATKQAEEQMERVRALRDRNGSPALTCASKCSLDSGLNKSSSPVTVENLSVWFQIAVPGSCPGSATEVTAFAQWTDSKGIHQSKVNSCFSGWRG